MKRAIVAFAVLVVPFTGRAETVTLNGVTTEVKIEREDKDQREGSLQGPLTIEVQGNRYELQQGQKIVIRVFKNTVGAAVLAKDTPIRLADHTFVLKGSSTVEFGLNGGNPDLLSGKLTQDAPVRVEGYGELVAKAMSSLARDIAFASVTGKVRWFYLAKETRFGEAPYDVVAPAGARFEPLSGGFMLESGGESTAPVDLQFTFLGQTGRAGKAWLRNSRITQIDLHRYVMIGGKAVPVYRVQLKEDGSLDHILTASINKRHAPAGAEVVTYKGGTKLFVNADGSAFSETLENLPPPKAAAKPEPPPPAAAAQPSAPPSPSSPPAAQATQPTADAVAQPGTQPLPVKPIRGLKRKPRVRARPQ